MVKSPSQKANEYAVIEALRGLAALAVFFGHSDASGLATNEFLSENRSIFGKFGVHLFFGVSGYLIWTSAHRYLPRSGGLKVYAIHRVTRILPLYLVNVAFAALLLNHIGSSFTAQPDWTAIWRHLTFTQGLSPRADRALNPVLWTLTHEAIFYCIVPLIFHVRQFVPLHYVAPLLVGLGILAFEAQLGPPGPFVQVFWAFSLGMLLVQTPSNRLLMFGFLFGAAATLAHFSFGIPQITIGLSALSFMAISLSEISLRFCAMRLVRLVITPIMMVGTISYSLYIWHYLLITIAEHHLDWLRSVVPGWNDGLIRGLIFTGAVLFLSWLSYLLLERPAMGPLRRLWLNALPKPKP